VKILLVISSLLFLVSCSSYEAVADKEYQKRAAEKADQQLDREVERYND